MENYWFSIMCTMSNNVYPLLIKISLFQPTVCQTSFFLSRFKHLTDSVQYSSLPLLFIYNTCFYIFKQRNNFLHRNLWCINPFFFWVKETIKMIVEMKLCSSNWWCLFPRTSLTHILLSITYQLQYYFVLYLWLEGKAFRRFKFIEMTIYAKRELYSIFGYILSTDIDL